MSTTLTRVLVVDDHVEIADWLADELTIAGYRAQTANDGATALEIVQSFSPDVMVVDIALPGMNGWEIARRVRKLELPVRPRMIALSAFQEDVHQERSRLVGFEDHLVKPIKIQDLLHAISNPRAPRSQGGVAT